MDTDMQNDLDNVYMKKSMACFAVDVEKAFAVKCTKLMPFLTPIISQVAKLILFLTHELKKRIPFLMRRFDGIPSLWIIEQVEEVIKQRLSSGIKRTDLLQLMLDAATHDDVKVNKQNNRFQ
jgi:hypothetical protein